MLEIQIGKALGNKVPRTPGSTCSIYTDASVFSKGMFCSKLIELGKPYRRYCSLRIFTKYWAGFAADKRSVFSWQGQSAKL